MSEADLRALERILDDKFTTEIPDEGPAQAEQVAVPQAPQQRPPSAPRAMTGRSDTAPNGTPSDPRARLVMRGEATWEEVYGKGKKAPEAVPEPKAEALPSNQPQRLTLTLEDTIEIVAASLANQLSIVLSERMGPGGAWFWAASKVVMLSNKDLDAAIEAMVNILSSKKGVKAQYFRAEDQNRVENDPVVGPLVAFMG